MITAEMRSAACAALNERGQGNAITIADVNAMLTAALALLPGEPVAQMHDSGDGFGLRPIWLGSVPTEGVALYAAPAPQPVSAQLNDREEAKLKADVARLIDVEAWKAMEGGRDRLEGSLWHLRRDWALEKASSAVSIIRSTLSTPHLSADRDALLEEARRVLKPFAAFANLAEGFVQARAEQGGSPILPTKHFMASDFCAARAFLSKLEGSSHAKA